MSETLPSSAWTENCPSPASLDWYGMGLQISLGKHGVE
jgi:hypothetical protein